jgi:hypothetical protein
MLDPVALLMLVRAGLHMLAWEDLVIKAWEDQGMRV